VAEYEQVLRCNPAHAAALHNLAGIAWQAGELALAAELYEQVLRVKPDYVSTDKNLIKLRRSTEGNEGNGVQALTSE